MTNLADDLRSIVKGDVDVSETTRDKFSHDASIFEVTPEVVVAPRGVADIQALVKYVVNNKPENPKLSLTARSAGTCMSGGAINDSIVLDMTKYFDQTEEVTTTEARVQPGVYYRDFELKTLEQGVWMPSYPASRAICTVGGMVANNAGGEKSLQFGKVENFVNELKVVFGDGNEYTVKPLTKKELIAKMAQNDYEGDLYKETFELIDNHYEKIQAAKPHVSKDSTGYHLWSVWDRESGVFDMTKLITGSQGTLGIVTDIRLRLVQHPSHNGTLVIFLRTIKDLAEIINLVLQHKPSAFEGFDNYTLVTSFKLVYFFKKQLGWLGFLRLLLQLIPEALKLFRRIPQMVLLVEFDGESPEDIKQKVHKLREDLKAYDHEAMFEEDETEAKAKKFWIMRRESFNILRQKVKDKHTAPFMDDLIVQPKYLPEFLPKISTIIKKYGFLATIAGHMGDGNFHIIPLMNIEKDSDKDKLEPAMREINALVLQYEGSLAGEHNDGMIRGSFLPDMYGEEVFNYFKRVKQIFDPYNIFNPHKKTDANWRYSMQHTRTRFDDKK